MTGTVAFGGCVLQILGPPQSGLRDSDMIPPPDLALLEPSGMFPDTDLPRIAPDGRRPMDVYARPVSPTMPRLAGWVALLATGPGPDLLDGQAAFDMLPGAVSVALSPYTARIGAVLNDIRAHGHEYLLSLPMEPDGYPTVDEGFRALLVGNDATLNQQNLEWSLTRFKGYVGVTGALDALRGGAYADFAPGMGRVMAELDQRGLMYVDPRPGQALSAGTPGCDVDLVIDGQAPLEEIDTALAQLETMARQHGAALGLIQLPRLRTAARVAHWARFLARRGVRLVPVSALVRDHGRDDARDKGQNAAP